MSKRVLVADDDPDNRNILRRRLERLGYGVVLAEDGNRALEALTAGAFDAVLLDSLMPALSGLEVLRRMRKEGDTTRVIMVTGNAFVQDVQQATDLGAHGYVTKPVDFARLVDLIET